MNLITRLALLSSSVWVVVLAGPSKPELSLRINSDSFDKGLGLGLLEPTVKWQTSGSLADCDVQGGLEMSVTEETSMPYKLWGKVKKTVGGIGLSTRVDTSSSNLNALGLDVQATKGATNLQIKGKADTGDASVSVNTVKVKQTLPALGGSLTLIPKYNLPAKKADVTVSYSTGGTVFTVDADASKQKVTIQQPLPETIGGSVAPSITTEGDITLSYSRPVGSGVVSATYKPNDFATVTYNDGPWSATVKAPMDSFGSDYKDRLSFSVGRSDVIGL